jgi:hypothetical protein
MNLNKSKYLQANVSANIAQKKYERNIRTLTAIFSSFCAMTGFSAANTSANRVLQGSLLVLRKLGQQLENGDIAVNYTPAVHPPLAEIMDNKFVNIPHNQLPRYTNDI